VTTELAVIEPKQQKVRRKGQFEPGNKLSVGQPGPWGNRFMSQALISVLNEMMVVPGKKPQTKEEITRFRKIINRLVDLGCEGDMRAIEFIFDRVEGKVRQQVDISGLEKFAGITIMKNTVTVINGDRDNQG
jgi:hypothetical protein